MTQLKELPAHWERKRLADVCIQVLGGGTPTTSKPEYWDGSIPWISSADVHGLKDIRPRRTITEKGLKESTTNLLPEGGIIVVTRVGLGKIAIAPYDLSFSQDSQGLILDEKVILKPYALLCLSRAVQIFKRESRGTTISGVTKKQLNEVSVPLPPIEEQERIVAKIEELFSELDAGVESLNKAQAQLKTYRQAVLKHAFEGRLTNENVEEGILPLGWELRRIEDVAKVGTGATPLKSNSSFYKDGLIVWVTSGALNEDYVRKATSFVTEKALRETNLTVYPRHTLLLAMYGEGKTRGKCSELLIDACTNQAIAAIDFTGFDETVRPYLKYFLHKNYNEIRTKSSGGVQPNINLGIVKNLKFPFCEKAERKVIVDEIESRLSVCDKLEESIEKGLKQSEALRQSILKQAFEGRLV